jgi:hypothetical protein
MTQVDSGRRKGKWQLNFAAQNKLIWLIMKNTNELI